MAHPLRSPPHLRQFLESWTRDSHLFAHRQSPKEDGESLLGGEKRESETNVREAWRTIRHVRIRRYIAFVGTAVSLLLLLTLAFSKRAAIHAQEPHDQSVQALHLLIPSPNLDLELCKTVLSAEVLQYSPPTLIQWDPIGKHAHGNMQRRMTAVRDHLETIAKHQENDTVILMDSISTWFQLRPEVLLKRYYDINRAANKRLASYMGAKTAAQQGIKQSIVFPASWNCGAKSFDDRGCHAIPASPLFRPADHMNAPRYLAQGVVIGPAKDLYEVYRRAVAIVERSQEFGNESEVFTEIFGQQEYQRSLLRRKPQSWMERFGGLFFRENDETQEPGDNPNEFSIGLDYTGELSLSTEAGPDTFTWSKHSRLSSDITSSMPPFWTPSGQDLPSSTTWTDLNLLTNAHTQSVPAMIQHNAKVSHGLLMKHWENLWLRRYSRQLLDASMQFPTMPLTVLRDTHDVERVFWSTSLEEKAGVKVAEGPWLGWDRLCPGEDLAREIFGDEVGEWKNPVP